MKPIMTAILLGTLAASPALAEQAPQPGPPTHGFARLFTTRAMWCEC